MKLAALHKIQHGGFLLLLLALLAFTPACSDDTTPGTSDTGTSDTSSPEEDTDLTDTDLTDTDLTDTDLTDTNESDADESDTDLDADESDADLDADESDADLDADESDTDLDADLTDTDESDADESDTDLDVDESDTDLDADEPDADEPDADEPDADEPDADEPGPPPGSLDLTFGTDGIAAPGNASLSVWPYSIAALSDDSIILVGNARSAGGEPSCLVQRVEKSGALAATFGTNGSFSFLPTGMNSCSLRAASTSTAGDTALLAGFASAGPQEVAITGRATTTQVEHNALRRGVYSLLSFHSVLPMADGRLIGAGRAFESHQEFIGTLTRHDQNLNVEASFGTSGFRDIAWTQPSSTFMVRDIAQLDAEHGLLVGTVERDLGDSSGLLIAFNLFTGALKADFGNAGLVEFGGVNSIDRFQSVVVSSDRIYAVGSRGFGGSEDIMVAAFTLAGVLDANYGSGGVALSGFDGRDRPYDSVLDASGRLLLAGEFDADGLTQPVALRVLTSGDFDTTFEWFGINALPFETNASEAWAIALDSTGHVLVAGRARDSSTNLDVPFLVRLVP